MKNHSLVLVIFHFETLSVLNGLRPAFLHGGTHVPPTPLLLWYFTTNTKTPK